jgi:hypothetical protein
MPCRRVGCTSNTTYNTTCNTTSNTACNTASNMAYPRCLRASSRSCCLCCAHESMTQYTVIKTTAQPHLARVQSPHHSESQRGQTSCALRAHSLRVIENQRQCSQASSMHHAGPRQGLQRRHTSSVFVVVRAETGMPPMTNCRDYVRGPGTMFKQR